MSFWEKQKIQCLWRLNTICLIICNVVCIFEILQFLVQSGELFKLIVKEHNFTYKLVLTESSSNPRKFKITSVDAMFFIWNHCLLIRHVESWYPWYFCFRASVPTMFTWNLSEFICSFSLSPEQCLHLARFCRAGAPLAFCRSIFCHYLLRD